MNNPLKYTDPSGYNFWDWANYHSEAIIGAAIIVVSVFLRAPFCGIGIVLGAGMLIDGLLHPSNLFNSTNKNSPTGGGKIGNTENNTDPNAGKTLVSNKSYSLTGELNFSIEQHGLNDCMYASTQFIFEFFGKNDASQDIIKELYLKNYGSIEEQKTGGDGARFREIVPMFFNSKPYTRDPETKVADEIIESLKQNHPFLANMTNDEGKQHSVVVYGFKTYDDGSQSVLYYDPNCNLKHEEVLSLSDFYSSYKYGSEITSMK